MSKGDRSHKKARLSFRIKRGGISRGKAGLCFVRINGHLYNPGRPRILAGLAFGSDERRHHVRHRIQDGTIRIHPGKLVLHGAQRQ